ncbi:MAG: BON domain-containing protein [Burkholderiales bacterium]|nr:BON domain-containing protein [Burkholderiales bacterium]
MFAALASPACSPRDAGGTKLDEAVADARAAAEAATRAAEHARGAVAGGAAESAADRAADRAVAAASDVAITSKVSDAIAADEELRMTRIRVETRNGRVVLAGSAPDVQSLERATALARAVDGVVWVENRLLVELRT